MDNHGSLNRLQRLGLNVSNDGNLIVPIAENNNGEQTNKDLNRNVEDIMKYFVMDTLWKPKMETSVIPEYNGAMTVLLGISRLYDIKQDANIQHLNERMQRLVHGKGQLEFNHPSYEKAITPINLIYKMTTFSGVALSVPVMITSGVGNLTELGLLALANEFGNPYKIFGLNEMHRAMMEVMTETSKVGALARHHQIMDMERFDMLNNQRWKETSNSFWDARSFHYLNWLTDYSVREVVMVAQMMYDGSYDAYTVDDNDEVHYDAKKDRRMFAADGTQTIEQKAYMKWVRDNLLKDRRVVNQEGSTLPLRGYDLQDQQKFQWIANRFVTGTYNHDLTGQFDSYISARLVAQFKKYLVDKIAVRVGGEAVSSEGGFKQIIIDEKGNTQEVWVKIKTTGAYVTTVKYLLNDVILPMYNRKFTDVVAMKDMSELQKHNMARMAFDALIFMGVYFLFTGLKNMTPPDKRNKELFSLLNFRLVTAVKNGWMTALAVTPQELISTLGIPTFENLKRLINLITFNGTQSDLRRLLPLKSSVDSFQQAYDMISNK
jgi:hypothetical protein